MDILEKIKKVESLMIQSYEDHQIPEWFVFEPYFNWKTGKVKGYIPLVEIKEMRSVVIRAIDKIETKSVYDNSLVCLTDEDDPFNYYRGYKDNAELMAFYNQILEDLTNMLIIIND